MTHFKSFKFALPIAVVLATTAMSFTPAKAEWQPAWQTSDGAVTLWYDADNSKYAVTIEKDGKFGVYFDKGVIDAVFDKWDNSNPNPDDPNNGKGTDKPDKEAILNAIKDAVAVAKVSLEDSPLGGVINGNGGGKVPHWNPGDDDNKGPSNPPSSKDHKGGLTAEQKANIQKQLNDAARQAASIKGGMFDGSEGGSENAPGLNKHGGTPINYNNGKGHGDEDGDGNNDYKDPNVPTGEELGPKPELVNPSPELKGRSASTAKTGNLSTMKVKKLDTSDAKGKNDTKADVKIASASNVMSSNPLRGGGGFSSRGLSMAGSGLGGGAMHSGISLRVGR